MTRRNRNIAIRFNNEGNVCYKNKQHKDAALLYTKAIELAPDVSHFYGNRGQAYYQLKLFDEAITDSLKAVKLDSTFWKGYIRAGKAHLRLGHLEEAKQHFNNALEAFPTHPEAISVAKFELETLAEATDQMRRAQESYEAEDYGDCIPMIEQLLPVVSHSVELYLMLADAYCQLGRYDHATALVDKLKQRFSLSDGQQHRLLIVEMRALGALTAGRWGLRDRVRTHWVGGYQPGDPLSLYACLGVDPSASQADIASAYTTLAAQCHPERQSESIDRLELEDVTGQYLDSTIAFIVLMDPELRELYELGVSPHIILADELDPFLFLCGLPSEGSDGDAGPLCARSCVNLSCAPMVAASTGACWLAQQLRSKLLGGSGEGLSWEEQKTTLLQVQRKCLLRAARERAAAAPQFPMQPQE